MFEMKEEFYTGISSIDEEHAELFRIAQRAFELYNAEFVPDKYDGIVSILEELKAYTISHFASEEAYMEKIQYKKLFTQKMEHQAFVDKLEEVDLSDLDEKQDAYILEILNFLNEWLVDHILEKDKMIPRVEE